VITDTVKDLALIRTQINADSTDLPDKIFTAKLAPENYTYYLFNPVYAIGCSLGLNPRPAQGIISAINLRTEGLRKSASHIEISAPIVPGNSGGPVYDARTYEVIGIAVWVKVCQGQLVTTMAGIVPINEIYEFLNNVDK
jgi:S1-C subfamily serine protease